eukprot:GHVQ01015156.1.p1 GENE.GHVQ01015156.1~~GHVQ01015156.1.p1  ORF type:complete len:255 (+),score=40.56 GHVQ01015156.1:166-930(+)
MSSSRGSQSLYDRHITIFSPDGHLYQVEYAFRAVKSCNMTAIAVKGKDTVVIVSQKKMPTQQLQQDKLLDPSCVTSVYNVTDEIGTVMLGRPADCRGIVYRSRSEAADFAEKKGYNIPVHWLAQRVADINQVYTQHAYMRPPACAGLFIAVDDEKGPSIYKFDPAGWFAGYKACAIGAKEQEATNALEKLVRKKERATEEETVQAAIGCLQTVLSVDFKPNDIEVGLMTVADPKFRRLTDEEIEEHLTAIAERD